MKYIVTRTHFNKVLGEEVKKGRTVEMDEGAAKPYLGRLEPKPLTAAQQKKADEEKESEDETETEVEPE